MHEEDDNKSLDLSYLGDEQSPGKVSKTEVSGHLGKDFFTSPRYSHLGKSQTDVKAQLSSLGHLPTPPKKEVFMPFVKVRCTSSKNKAEVLAGGEIILTFDENGIAQMPAHLLPLFKKIQNLRPGRYTIVVPEVVVPKAVSAPKVDPKLEPVKESVSVESKVHSEPEEEDTQKFEVKKEETPKSRKSGRKSKRTKLGE